MKDKIFAALKNKFKDLGFSDKAFDGVAAFLATTIKEEADIDNSLEGVDGLLKSLQGDIDSRVAKYKVDAEKWRAERKKNKDNPGGDPPQPNPQPPAGGENSDDDAPAWA